MVNTESTYIVRYKNGIREEKVNLLMGYGSSKIEPLLNGQLMGYGTMESENGDSYEGNFCKLPLSWKRGKCVGETALLLKVFS